MNQEPNFEEDRGSEEIPVANSPTTSVSSLFSEQSEMTRNSPFQLCQSSPLSAISLFQRPDFLNASVPDSETSSRSSYDGINLRDSTSEKIEKFRSRRSSSGSASENDDEESDKDVVRKSSSLSEDNKFIGRAIDAPRGRIANIRRESNCSVESEVAHERMMKVSQQVSTGFDDFSIEPDRSPSSDFRRRTPSFSTSLYGEPISVVTNAFMPHSCSPSPTRLPETFKQCYSPSTQQIIRPLISFSPSPKQSPSQSPTRHPSKKYVRSVSPIMLGCRQGMKRKLIGKDMDMEAKRAFIQRNNTSPLVSEKIFPYPASCHSSDSGAEFASPSMPHSPGPALDLNRTLTPTSSLNGNDESDDSLFTPKSVKKNGSSEKSDDKTTNNDIEMECESNQLDQALAAPLPITDDF